MSDNKAYFNSYVTRDDYEVIKTEAYRLQITTKHHISNILSDYATLKRKEIIRDSEKLMTEIKIDFIFKAKREVVRETVNSWLS